MRSKRADGIVDAMLETLLPDDILDETSPGRPSNTASEQREGERLRCPWPRARIRVERTLKVPVNSDTLSLVTSMCDCELRESQSDAGGVSGAAVRMIVVGREGGAERLSAKMLRCTAGARGR